MPVFFGFFVPNPIDILKNQRISNRVAAKSLIFQGFSKVCGFQIERFLLTRRLLHFDGVTPRRSGY